MIGELLLRVRSRHRACDANRVCAIDRHERGREERFPSFLYLPTNLQLIRKDNRDDVGAYFACRFINLVNQIRRSRDTSRIQIARICAASARRKARNVDFVDKARDAPAISPLVIPLAVDDRRNLRGRLLRCFYFFFSTRNVSRGGAAKGHGARAEIRAVYERVRPATKYNRCPAAAISYAR